MSPADDALINLARRTPDLPARRQTYQQAYQQTIGKLAASPNLGMARESVARLQEGFDAFVSWNLASTEYQAVLGEIWEAAFRQFGEDLAALAEKGEKITEVRELVLEFKDYRARHYRDRRWVSPGWLESMRPYWVEFGHGYGRRYTMPMFLDELRPLGPGELETLPRLLERRCVLPEVAEDGGEPEAAGRLEAPVAGGRGGGESFAEERLRLLGAAAPALELAEGGEAGVNPAGVSDGSGGLEGSIQVLLGGGDVAELEVEEGELLEPLDPLATQARGLVARERGADELEPLAVSPRLDEERPLPLQPVGLFLREAGLAGEREGAVEVRDGLGHLSQPGVAEGEVAEVLAHRRLVAEALADRERLPVEAERLAEASEEEGDASEVPEGVSFAPREVRPAVQVEGAAVLRDALPVVAKLVVHEREVVERRALELRFAEVAADRRRLLEIPDRLRVFGPFPVNESEVAQGFPFLQPVAQLSLHRQRLPQEGERLVEVAEALVAVADEAEGDRLALPVPGRAIPRERLLEERKGLRGPLLLVDLAGLHEEVLGSGRRAGDGASTGEEARQRREGHSDEKAGRHVHRPPSLLRGSIPGRVGSPRPATGRSIPSGGGRGPRRSRAFRG